MSDKDIVWYPTLNDIMELIKSGADVFKVVIKDIEDGSVVDTQVDSIIIIGTIVNKGYSLEKCKPTNEIQKEWYLHCKKKGDDNV